MWKKAWLSYDQNQEDRYPAITGARMETITYSLRPGDRLSLIWRDLPAWKRDAIAREDREIADGFDVTTALRDAVRERVAAGYDVPECLVRRFQ